MSNLAKKPDIDPDAYVIKAFTLFPGNHAWLDFTAEILPDKAVITATDGLDGEWLNTVAETLSWMAHSRAYSKFQDGAGI